MTFRPLLAATLEDVRQVIYPKILSPKLDGIRCIIIDGVAVSRNLKPIRNQYIQACLKGLPNGLDGELIVGDAFGELVFNRTSSGVMSQSGEPNFKFHVFDHAFAFAPYHRRWDDLLMSSLDQHPNVQLVPHWDVKDEAQLIRIEQLCIDDGFEGIMLRSLDGMYKHGRSTLNEQILLKLKRFKDGEAQITGYSEGVHNLNEATKDALGLTKRSTHQDNKVGSGRIGTLYGKDIVTGEPLVISPGRMTLDDREKYFKNPLLIMDRIAKYKSFEYGRVFASRFVTFQGFRHADDA